MCTVMCFMIHSVCYEYKQSFHSSSQDDVRHLIMLLNHKKRIHPPLSLSLSLSACLSHCLLSFGYTAERYDVVCTNYRAVTLLYNCGQELLSEILQSVLL